MLLDDARLFRVIDHPLDHGRPRADQGPARFAGATGASA
jgi:hypothetical protein